MAVLFSNNATATLIAPMNTTTTLVSVATGDATVFPQPVTAYDWFPLTLMAAAGGAVEIVHCTSRDGGNLTVVRAREGTTALSFAIGARVDHRATAAALREGVNMAISMVSSGDEPPADAPPNAIWYESDTGKLFLKYPDINSSQWVETFSASSTASGVATIDWANVANKPATFPPTLPIAQSGVSGLEVTLTTLTTDKAPLASPALTGTPTAPTAASSTNTTQIATTAFVKTQGYATLADATLTGDPKAPTPSNDDNDTSIATTAFVKNQGYAPIDSPVFTNNPRAPTQPPVVRDTRLATTEYVSNSVNAARAATNIMVNPCMTISQENGQVLSTITSVQPPYYGCDQWFGVWSMTEITARLSSGIRTTATDSPEGVSTGRVNSMTLDVTGAQTALEASDYAQIVQRVEGYRIVELKWPLTSGGVRGLLTFWVKFPLAGTYCARIGGDTDTITYLAEYVVAAANVWQQITIVIPPPAIGTWAISNANSLTVAFPIAAGTTYRGVLGWQTGYKLTTAAAVNGMATVGRYLISKVGLYADPLGLGVPTDWKYQIDSEELQVCQRYFYKTPETPASMVGFWYGPAGATNMFAGTLSFPVTMRVTPTAVSTTAPTYTNCSALAFLMTAQEATARVTVTAVGSYRAYSGLYTFNARLP